MHLTLIEGEYFEIKCELLEDYTVLCTLVLFIGKTLKKLKIFKIYSLY